MHNGKKIGCNFPLVGIYLQETKEEGKTTHFIRVVLHFSSHFIKRQGISSFITKSSSYGHPLLGPEGTFT